MIQEKGKFFCDGCSKLTENNHCEVYSVEGQNSRIHLGHCPAAWCPKVGDGNRMHMWAYWRTDKPKAVRPKKHIGQQKQLRRK